jgi:hypothetical protein
MDATGRIYQAPEDQIPAADKARLDGFLKGRAEADLLDDVKAAAFEAKVREMEAAMDR